MTFCSLVFIKYTFLRKLFFSKINFNFFFQNWYRSITLDPDPNSMYLDPQHWSQGYGGRLCNNDATVLMRYRGKSSF